MRNRKKIWLLGILIGLALIFPSGYLLFLSDTPEPQIDIKLSQEKKEETFPIDSEEELQKNDSPVEITEGGWIPNWELKNAINILEKNKDILSSFSPVIYSLSTTGKTEIRGISQSELNHIVDYSQKNNISIIPTLSSHNYDSTDSLFKNQKTYRDSISFLISEINKYSFNGIDLDIELIRNKHKQEYLAYIKELSEALPEDKILSITVWAKWGTDVYERYQDSRDVQDYESIGRYADIVRVMGYDYTDISSSIPGPVGPIYWVEDVLAYTLKHIQREKIVLGIPLYGYEWIDSKGYALTYTSIQELISKNKLNTTLKEDVGEMYGEFKCNGGKSSCKIYFQSKESIYLRKDIAKRYGIKGIYYWSLGKEGDILQ